MEAAASIIAFVQITSDIVKCMIKAKQIWDQSKDLPEDIRDLTRRLQHYKEIFENMHSQLSDNTDHLFFQARNDALVLNSLKISEQAQKALEAFITDLSAQLSAKKGFRRKLFAIKSAMGKDTIERLKVRLRESLELLEASERAYNIWLSQSVLELQSNPTLWSSNYSFRVYNIVSYDSDVVQMVRKGDKNGVLQLFSSRKASPFDKDEYGSSLLYHAAYNGNYDMCRFLLNAGLQESLEETVGKEKNSPLSALVYQSEKKVKTQTEDVWAKISELFNSYLDEPESTMIVRLFDFIQEWAYGDEYVFVFQRRVLKKFYTGPIENRLEAFRLGSFHLKTPRALLNILSESKEVTASDVDLSSRKGMSLVHSSAIALGIRFADEVLPYKRVWCQWSVYSDAWSDVVTEVASVATQDDLHHIETVSPWDVYHVPSWQGTPLISLLGGALCYISPDISFLHWDSVFQGTIRRWVEDLEAGGVDLLEYGRREAIMLKEQMRGAFDADAIELSKHQIRNPMASSAETSRVGKCKEGGWNQTHWVPVRLLDLDFGSKPEDWRITWAPEFEWMAFQFWKLIEREDHTMPGSWID
ncbi:hypothetical protein HG530_004407 [Fusarium avenaceum]|nr:hypothetical protein HG530_004407 [Fusarium avenaceum]